MYKILYKALRLTNHLHVSNADLRLQLQSHPDFPNVKAITDTLDYFGIENLAATVPKEYFDKLPKFFLALLTKEHDPGYALVTKRKDKLILDFENNKREILSRDLFDTKWSGTIVAFEKVRESKTQIKIEQFSLPIILTLLLASSIYSEFDLLTFSLTLLSGGGLFLSYLIVKEELGLHSQTVASVCSAFSATNCVATIKSDSSKLSNYFSMADASLIFFMALSILNVIIKLDYTTCLVLLFTSLPFLLYTLYLQGFVLKQWCFLCLAVTILIVAQLTLILALASGGIVLNIPFLLKSGLMFALVFVGWINLKPLIKSHLQLPLAQQNFLKFKRNNKVFDSLLRQKKVEMDAELEGKLISFGADHVTTIVTFITNPFCGYCVESYKVYKGLLKTHGNSIKLNILFNVSTSDKENKAYQIGIKLIELYQTGQKELALTALDDWFMTRDVERWQNRYGTTNADLEKYEGILHAQKNWCASNKINYTPATIIDRYLYPNEYKISDLPALIDQLGLEKKDGS